MIADTLVLRRSAPLAAAALLLAAGTASASVAVTDPFLVIRATSGLGTSTYVVNVPSGAVGEAHDANNDFWWTDYSPASPTPIPMFDGPNLIGVINTYGEIAYRSFNGSTYLFGIDMNFNVNAGNADTTFEIFSTTLSFGPIQFPNATASAGLVGTDANADGITIAPGLLSGHAYLAEYNLGDFRRYLSSVLTNGPTGSVNDQGNMTPPGSYVPIAGPAVSMDLLYKFTVTRGDEAGGTTSFSMFPAPSTVSLIGLGALATTRRRRR